MSGTNPECFSVDDDSGSEELFRVKVLELSIAWIKEITTEIPRVVDEVLANVVDDFCESVFRRI